MPSNRAPFDTLLNAYRLPGGGAPPVLIHSLVLCRFVPALQIRSIGWVTTNTAVGYVTTTTNLGAPFPVISAGPGIAWVYTDQGLLIDVGPSGTPQYQVIGFDVIIPTGSAGYYRFWVVPA